MRCCIQTFWEKNKAKELPTEPGSRIECRFCGAGMTLRQDKEEKVWGWDGTTKVGDERP
jgi:hypothetical protein